MSSNDPVTFLWMDDNTDDVPTFEMPVWLRRVLPFDRGSRTAGRGVAVSDIPVGPRPSGTAVKRSK